jgi:2-dehydropantoate 2-reductase
MKVLIAGSGTTGGLLGARLIERGIDTTFCVRPRRKAQLLTTGLRLYSPYGRFRRHVSAITPDEITTQFDVVVIAPRAHSYGDAVKAVQMAFGPSSIIVPIVEGADHLQSELIHGGHLIGGRLEARISIDADGFLGQRGPVAELSLGACDPLDSERAEWLAHFLGGRGLKAMVVPRIGDAIWERYCFSAACVAVNASTGTSVRDAIRSTNHITSFDRLMAEASNVGRKIGLQPRPGELARYRSAYRMESRPVQPPALITDGGARADEAVYLLVEMVEIATRAGMPVPRLRAARDKLLRPSLATATTVDGDDVEAA